jgi:hypothetical protein
MSARRRIRIESRASDAERQRKWLLVTLALGQLVEQEPRNAVLYLRRGLAHLAMKNVDHAVLDLALAHHLDAGAVLAFAREQRKPPQLAQLEFDVALQEIKSDRAPLSLVARLRREALTAEAEKLLRR